MKTALMEVASRQFRPEFINRVDDTVVFHPLAQAILAGRFGPGDKATAVWTPNGIQFE
ncbi:MAG: hypothetical protein GY862_26110 [Gammaproteobacteria bacterium]|nr:hypothetical protein [Gammaproteobacteria bacterium]